MTITKTIVTSCLIINIILLSTDICYGENSPKMEVKYDTAILKYEKDLADNPRDPKLHYSLATLFYAVGDKKKAIEEFQKAKELYIAQGNIEAALQLENTLSTLTLPEALREIEKRIEDLEVKIKEINKVLKKE